MDELNIEYNAWLNGENKEPSFCVWCWLRNMNSPCALLCRHIISNETLLNVKAIHPRYIRDQTYENEEYSLVQLIKNKRQKSEYAYSTLMERISPFASQAAKNHKVKEIFRKTLEELDNIMEEINENMPKTIITQGRPFVTPSSNVMCNRGHNRKGHCCSICGEMGHNKQTCPSKNKN